MSAAVCNVCNEVISGRVLTALDKKWHPEHFTCAHCRQPIGGAQFHQHEGRVYCVDDYTQLFLQRCHACAKPIADKVIKALDACWHDACWKCASCKAPLGTQSFVERAGAPHCQPCNARLFAPRCHGCDQPVTSKVIIAFDHKWHQDCFKCGKCSKPVTESSFQVTPDNKPLCGKCS